jgi:hypothetical protein
MGIIQANCKDKDASERTTNVTCNFFLQNMRGHFRAFFKNQGKEDITVTDNAEKILWTGCEVIVTEDSLYLFAIASGDAVDIKRFSNYDSVRAYFAERHGDMTFKFEYCEAVANSFPAVGE